ncbi:nuclear cap-binding protein, partial [Cystoisospora suis]
MSVGMYCFLCGCVYCRLGIYSCVVGLWFKKSRLRSLCLRVVDASFERFEGALRSGDFYQAKLLLRFFLALSGSYVVSLESVFETIKNLLILTAELPSTSATTADNLLLVVLSSLPWMSTKAWEAYRPLLDEVLALGHQAVSTSAEASSASPEGILLQQATLPIRVFSPSSSTSSSDSLASLSLLYHPNRDPGNDGLLSDEVTRALISLGLHQNRLGTLLDALTSMVEAEWKSKTTLRFYQSNDLYPLLKPSLLTSTPTPNTTAGSTAPPLVLTACSVPPLTLTLEDLHKIKAQPLGRVLRLPISIEKVDLPLSSHDR